MAAEEHPLCETRFEGRVKGVITHAKCANPASDRYLALVRPVDCRRCLGLEAAAAVEPPVKAPEPPEPPGLVRRAISYTEALARWTAAGRPERSDKEVERIFHQQCKPCKWYDPERQICRGCGRRVAENGYAVLNKIKMAIENCPRNLW